MIHKSTPRCESPPPVYAGPVPSKELEEKMHRHTGCLEQCDLYLGLDKSGSMRSYCAGSTRWERLKDVVKQLAPYSTRVDTDGIDIFFVEKEGVQTEKCKTADEVEKIFEDQQPGGGTPLGWSVWNHLNPYLKDLSAHAVLRNEAEERIAALKAEMGLALKQLEGMPLDLNKNPNNPFDVNPLISFTKRLEKEEEESQKHSDAMPKPRNYIFITDGKASDSKLLMDTILYAEEFLKKHRIASFKCRTCKPNKNGVPNTHRQLGIQFVQIGNDIDARAFLQELDDMEGVDENNQRLPDIVDTTIAGDHGTLTLNNLVKTLLGGLDSKFDSWQDAPGQPNEGAEKEFIVADHWNDPSQLGHVRCEIGTRTTGPGCWCKSDLNGVWVRNPLCV